MQVKVTRIPNTSIGYHFLIFPDGTVCQTRKISEVGAHCKAQGMNFKSIGICVVGDFTNYEPTIPQVKAVKKLVAELRKQYGNLPTRPHRYYADTECFGMFLDDDYFDITSLQLSFIELLQKWKNFLSRR